MRQIRRIFIIGRMLEKDGKTSAYKIYDEKKDTMSLVSKEYLCKLAKIAYSSKPQEIEILGFQPKNSKLDAKGYPAILERQYMYRMSDIDIVDGFGDPIEDTGIKILMDVMGAGVYTMYHVIDSRGRKAVIENEQFNNLLHEGKIIGAHYANGKTMTYKYCKKINTFM